MFAANVASPPSPVANNRSAPGARSWTISSIAVPSSPLPDWSGRMCTFSGRSSVAWLSARLSTPSEITPTTMPEPSTPCVLRAAAAAWATSPWLVLVLLVASAFLLAWVRASSASRMACTVSASARRSSADTGKLARTAR